MRSLAISRVLSWMVIYLVRPLPDTSSGYRTTDGQSFV